MAVPHRNNVTVGAASSPNDHEHSAVKKTGADAANLTIVKSVVDHRHGIAGKHLLTFFSKLLAADLATESILPAGE
jgi:hypothetical protein